jgi:hypothetical protein
MSETETITPLLTTQPGNGHSDAYESSYYEQRLAALGITAELNQVKLWRYNSESNSNELQPVPVFKSHPRGIEIVPYTITRNNIRIEKESSRIKKDWSIIRLEKPIVKDGGDILKYLMPKGHGSHPLYSPNILDAYESKTDIHTLVLTEGFFKCWKGFMAGLYIIGLPSITHMEDKEKKTIHPEIIQLIERCNVRHMIWLTDGDAVDISKDLETTDADGSKKLKDLYKRPNNFYHSIQKFNQLLYDFKSINKYWAYIDIYNIIQSNPNEFNREQLKGLDDLLCSLPDKQEQIVNDLMAVSKPGHYFNKFDITIHTGRVREHFHLDNPTKFYQFHVERRPDLKGKDFVFHGTQYKFNDETGECDVVVPARAKDYFRVGDDYYKFIHKPNKYKQLEKIFKGRRKQTIIDDHSRDFVKHIPRFEEFCNVPDNTNFQQIIHNCFNVYSPLEYKPDDDPCTEEDCPSIIGFLHHVFGDRKVSFKHPKTGEKLEYSNFDLALDYIQVLYQYPAEKLPILCLVSKENKTGKTTLAKLIKLIFSANVAIVGNQDLAGDFNAHWATKLVVICDETKIDKQHVVEKVKSLSTADKITMNAKGKDHVELDCFIKFIFITNNEENFIYMNDEDIRYWIIKVPVLKQENPHIAKTFIEEIPAFLSFLNQRKIKTEQLGRMWFHEALLKTEAMKKVIEFSRSTVQKEIRQRIRDMFMDFGVNEIKMTRIAIHKEFFNGRYEANYIEKVLKEEMKIDQYHKLDPENKDLYGNPEKIYVNNRHSYPKWDEVFKDGNKHMTRVEVEGNGRPYVFKREDFLTPDELTRYQVDEQTNFENKMISNSSEPTQGSLYNEGSAGADNSDYKPNDDLPF